MRGLSQLLVGFFFIEWRVARVGTVAVYVFGPEEAQLVGKDSLFCKGFVVLFHHYLFPKRLLGVHGFVRSSCMFLWIDVAWLAINGKFSR